LELNDTKNKQKRGRKPVDEVKQCVFKSFPCYCKLLRLLKHIAKQNFGMKEAMGMSLWSFALIGKWE
jgi:hypothetical protein